MATLFTVVWSALTIVALTWGTRTDVPDYLQESHGFPLVWATHDLGTIAGPVDIWSVDLSALIIDLSFWLGLMVLVLIVMFRLLSDGSPGSS